jgi:hypothetical protein
MTGTKRLFGWLVACAFVLAGAGVAQADGGHWKHKLTGEWNNSSTGENLKIVRGAIGWEVWLSNSGEARLTADSDDGTNVQISGKGLSCEYYLTMVNQNLINMQLRDGDPADSCLKGTFVRVSGIKEPMHHVHVIVRHVYVRHHWCRCRW